MNINALFTHKHTSALLVLAFEATTQPEFNKGLSEAENEAARQMRQFSTEVETLTGNDAQLATWIAAYEPLAPEFQPIARQADAWANDHLQFARLLRELDLAGAYTPAVMARLTESMDCEEAAIDQLIERVTTSFEEYQSRDGKTQSGYLVTWRIDVLDSEATSPYEAAAYAEMVMRDPENQARTFEVYHKGSGAGKMICLDYPPDNRWKIVDITGDPHRAYEEEPAFLTNEAEALAAYQKLADAGRPVRLYSCYDDGDDLTEWDLLEEANWPEDGSEETDN